MVHDEARILLKNYHAQRSFAPSEIGNAFVLYPRGRGFGDGGFVPLCFVNVNAQWPLARKVRLTILGPQQIRSPRAKARITGFISRLCFQ